jgi:hypothetical protein
MRMSLEEIFLSLTTEEPTATATPPAGAPTAPSEPGSEVSHA